MPKIRLLVAESNELARLGLKLCLGQTPDLTVVDDAADGASAVKKVSRTHPDVIILDSNLLPFGAPNVAARLHHAASSARVIILGWQSDDLDLCAAFAAGIAAYCVKNIPLDHLSQIIREVFAGRTWIDPETANRILGIFGKHDEATGDSRVGLSQTERNLLGLLAAGLSMRGAAEHSGVKLETVSRQLKEVFRKLGCLSGQNGSQRASIGN